MKSTDGLGLLVRAQAAASSVSIRLGLPPLDVSLEPSATCKAGFGASAERYADRAFMACVLYDHRRVHLIPANVEAMPDDLLEAMMAHEAGHDADWLAKAIARWLRMVLPERAVRAWRLAARDARERFADRVAAHLVGRDAVRRLIAFTPPGDDPLAWDCAYIRARDRAASRLPERPGLPWSLRLRLSHARIARPVDFQAVHRNVRRLTRDLWIRRYRARKT